MKEIITAEFRRKEMQEIGIALMGRFNLLSQHKADGEDISEFELKEIQHLIARVSAFLEQ